jgi:hypothetical protein
MDRNLNPAIRVVDEAVARLDLPRVDGHLERVEGEVRAQRGGDLPPDDEAAEDVDHKGDVDEARVGLHIGEVGHPEPVGRRRAEVPIDEVSGSRQQLVGDGRLPAPATANPSEARGRHEPLDRAAGHAHFLPVELGPDLVGAVDAAVGLVDPGDLDLQLFVAQRPCSRRTGP